MRYARQKYRLAFSDFTTGWALFGLITVVSTYIFVIITFHGFLSKELDSIIGSIFFLAFSISSFALGNKLNKQKSLIEDIPTSNIKSIALGVVELEGKIKKIYELVSPASKMKCVYFKYTIEIKMKDSQSSGYTWKEISHIESNFPFYIEDGTGKVIIECKNLDLHFEPRSITYDAKGNRHTEWFVLDKEPVYLIGTAKKAIDCMYELKKKINEAIQEIKNDRERLAQFDLDKNGTIDIDEWDKAVEQIKNDIMQREANRSDLNPLADVIVSRDTENDIFILSERSEKDLVKQLKWKTTGFILAGIGTFLVSIYFLFNNFPSGGSLKWQWLF